MPANLIPLLIILAVTVGVFVALYFLGKKLQKKQDEQQASLDAVAQQMTFFIIDKKKLKIKDAGLPKMVYDQTPKYLRPFTKLPILKVKIGPKVMSLVCDAKVFDTCVQELHVYRTLFEVKKTFEKIVDLAFSQTCAA